MGKGMLRLPAAVALTCLMGCGARQEPSPEVASTPPVPEAEQPDAGAAETATPGREEEGALSDAADKAKTAGMADTPPDPTSAVSAMQEALRALRSKRMTEARAAAGNALWAMADALAGTAAGTGRQVTDAVEEVRFQAQRLRRADFTFEGAQWSKRGLTAALDGIEELRSASAADLEPWLNAARRAVGAIASDQSITFQRAEIQDGFRTVSNVFAILLQGEVEAPPRGPANER